MSAEENTKLDPDTDDSPKTMSQDDISSLIAELAGNKEEDAAETGGEAMDDAPAEASDTGPAESESQAAPAIEISENGEDSEASDVPAEPAANEPETGGEDTADDAGGPATMSQDDISSLIAELSGQDEAAPPQTEPQIDKEEAAPQEAAIAVEESTPPENKDPEPPQTENTGSEPAGVVEKSADREEAPQPLPETKKDEPASGIPEPDKEMDTAPAAPTKEKPAAAEPPRRAVADQGSEIVKTQPEKPVERKPAANTEPKATPKAANVPDKVKPPKTTDPEQAKSEKIKEEIEALLEADKVKPKKSRKKMLTAVVSVVIFLILAGSAAVYFLYLSPMLQHEQGPVPATAQPEADIVKVVPKKIKTAADGSERTVFEFEADEPEQVLGGKLSAAMNLRDDLLVKSSEIEGLKQYYRGGISAMENEIREEIVKRDIRSMKTVEGHPEIFYLLQVIQRRQAYIKGLDAPSRWVEYGSEELLYIYRKAEIAIMMKDVVGGINLNEVQAEITDIINKYQMDSDRLGMDSAASELQPIDAIWNRIYTQARNKNSKSDQLNTSAAAKNQAIWIEICNGNYDRKYELTALSPAAAKCLAKSEESDLFLNNIKSLSVESAGNLFQWEGNWLCLNGFKELNAGMARQLSQWDGNWVSLNGVTDISVDAARQLSQWSGRQIELMGLKYSEGRTRLAALKHLAKWKNKGGKLYVPGKIEQQIDNMLAQE